MIVNELAYRGHNVTVISPYSNKNAPPGAHYIRFGDDFQSILPEYLNNLMNSNESKNPFLEQLMLADAYVTIYSRECFSFFMFH